jgi:lipopolysaccharide transport system permease protein
MLATNWRHGLKENITCYRAADRGPGFVRGLKDLYRHRGLLITWTMREVRIRYSQSLLGAAWAILQPLSLMLIYTVIFAFFVRIPSDGIPYPVFSYMALLPWTFFASSLGLGTASVTNNMSLVTKIYFPREIFPLASVGASFIDFLVAAGLFVVMLAYYSPPQQLTALLWLPALLSIQIAMSTGVVLLASAVNVFYRDVRFLIPLVTQLWLYATPVIYPVSLVPERFRTLYMLNPMAGLIDGYRQVLLHGRPPDLEYFTFALVISIGLFVGAYRLFKRAELTFADVI